MELVYDSIDRCGVWKFKCEECMKLEEFVEGSLQSFNLDSMASVREGMNENEWFPVNVSLRLSCAMNLWLFNVSLNGVVQEVNAKVRGKGLERLRANGGKFEINQLLFANDAALVADSAKKLCFLASEFDRVCERIKLLVNIDKSKVMKCSRYVNVGRMDARLIGEPLEEEDCLEYIASQAADDVECERDVVHRINEGYTAWRALKSVLSN